MDKAQEVSVYLSADFTICLEIACFYCYSDPIADFYSYNVHCISFCYMNLRRKSDILFILCLLIFLIHQFVERILKVEVALLDNYLDPLLAMPVILHLITLERRILTRNQGYRMPWVHIVLYFIIVSVIVEIVFPMFNPKLIGDPMDVVLYAIGTGFYAMTLPPAEKLDY